MSCSSCSHPPEGSVFLAFDGLKLLADKVEIARRRLHEFLASIGGWHAGTSISSLNIIAALYGSWVPRGREIGVERTVVISKGHLSP
ncbi:MAG: hypothetical protein GSR73_03165, partial [Desulfurococcales archaeon]|nr:hypothetical protein [Desulfurococcales archaeon]